MSNRVYRKSTYTGAFLREYATSGAGLHQWYRGYRSSAGIWPDCSMRGTSYLSLASIRLDRSMRGTGYRSSAGKSSSQSNTSAIKRPYRWMCGSRSNTSSSIRRFLLMCCPQGNTLTTGWDSNRPFTGKNDLSRAHSRRTIPAYSNSQMRLLHQEAALLQRYASHQAAT
ncbi:hypothetical protein SAMN05518855_101113 [Paenibacillus sp. CF384]|nr:hypothetical protein SAMN05518855_101113 [Paenibacillus sp. CF384]